MISSVEQFTALGQAVMSYATSELTKERRKGEM